MNYLKVIGAGIVALGLSLPVWAEMSKEEIIAKVEAGLSQAQRTRDHDQRVAAVEALLRAGVAPEQTVELVSSALARDVPVAEVVQLARDVETRAHGDKAQAEQDARESFAAAEKRHEASHQLQTEIASPSQGEHNAAGTGSGFGSGSGFGGGDLTGATGAGMGAGQGMGGR